MTSTTRTALIEFAGVTAAVALAVGVAGCSDEPKPKHAAAHPTPTASSTPEKPEKPQMPDVARAKSRAGARAFAEYFVETVSYANQTLNTAPFEVIAEDHCEGCNGAIDFLRKWKTKDGTVVGGKTTVKSIEVSSDKGIRKGLAIVNVSMQVGRQEIRTAKERFRSPTGLSRMQLFLAWQPSGGWLITSLVSVKK